MGLDIAKCLIAPTDQLVGSDIGKCLKLVVGPPFDRNRRVLLQFD